MVMEILIATARFVFITANASGAKAAAKTKQDWWHVDCFSVSIVHEQSKTSATVLCLSDLAGTGKKLYNDETLLSGKKFWLANFLPGAQATIGDRCHCQ